MIVDIDIKQVKEKAMLMIPKEQEDVFNHCFDNDLVYDLMDNVEDYIAEGLVSYFLTSE